jgi:hypothetical protein
VEESLEKTYSIMSTIIYKSGIVCTLLFWQTLISLFFVVYAYALINSDYVWYVSFFLIFLYWLFSLKRFYIFDGKVEIRYLLTKKTINNDEINSIVFTAAAYRLSTIIFSLNKNYKSKFYKFLDYNLNRFVCNAESEVVRILKHYKSKKIKIIIKSGEYYTQKIESQLKD